MRWLILCLLPSALCAEGVVSTRIIRAGAVIEASDLTLTSVSKTGAVRSIEEIAGLEAKVMIYPGRPVLYVQVGNPAIIERNQVVPLIFAAGGLEIETEGRALSRGGEGDLIRVLNISSKVTVRGLVQANGSIRVEGIRQ